jgi:hypothetical protein
MTLAPARRRALDRAVSAVVVVALAAAAGGSLHAGRAPDPLDKLFGEFWKAEDVRGAERAAEKILKSDAPFDALYLRLKAGREYGKEKVGDFSIRFAAGAGLLLDNAVSVPIDYTPERRWTLRVQLHGGVNRRAAQTLGGAALEEEETADGGRAPSLGRRRAENRIPGEPQIYVFPTASADAAWWHVNQVDNILRVVDRLKRRYNIDETRIYLTGISDGGTGTYYMAMKDPTVWSAFLPLNGSIKVLGNPAVRAEGEMFAGNLVNRPFYIVNGGRDPLYPVEHVATHVEAFKRLGVPLVFRPQPAAGHDTSWWPYERGLFEQFVKQRPREPQPVRISWETERTDRFNRADWLVIDALGASAADAAFEDLDLFEHKRPSGRVDVERRGNVFTARSRGVRAFTLLLSPDAIDFDQPVTVRLNGADVFQGRVETDRAALMKWAARDADRQRLYAAELKVQAPQ